MRNLQKSIFRHFTLIIICWFFNNSAFAQPYIVKCDISTSYWSDGICNSNRRFKNLDILSLTTYYNPTNYSCNYCPVYWSHSGDYNNSESVYVVLNSNRYLGLEFDPTEYESAFGRVLNFYVNSAKSYGTLSHSDNKWVGACNYKGSISFTVNAYDIPRINSVSYPSCASGYCSGSSFCINNDNDNLRFNLSVTNHGNASLTIYAYDKSNNVIGSASIGTYNSTEYATVSSLGIPSNYNGEVRFRVRSSLSGQTAYGSYSSYYIFSKMLPAPTSKIMTRTACLDEVRLTMPSGIAANHSNYRFIWIDGTRDISLTSYYRGGNYIYLRNNSASPFPTSSGSLTIQIADKTSDNCARNFSVSHGSKPSYLSITATPIVKATFDGTSYHVSRYGASDGEITLQVTGGSGSRISRCEYYNGGWQTIPSGQLIYVNSTTRRFTGLAANRTNYIRVFDTDGCVNSYTTVSGLRQPSDVTLNQPTATTVTCHKNNSGSGSKSDGLIQATCNGGIGNYTARLYNNSGTLLETKTVTASDKSGSNYFVQFSPRGVGRYRVRITDRYGVYKDQYVDVTSNPEVILTATPTDLTCFEGGNGSVQLSATNLEGGTPTYTLTGRTESLTTYQNLSAGNYTASATNYLGCQDIVNNILVGQPNDIIIDATGSKIARYADNTGTIDLIISEGTGGFDYILYKGSSEITNGSTSQNATITGLYDGYYRVEVTDDNGCPQTHNNIRVRQPDAPLELSFSQQPQNVDCYGNATGEVYPTASGGWGHYQYGFNGTILGTSNTIGGLTATGAIADTVFVVDSAGVIEKLPVTITEPTQLVAAIDNIYNLKCFEDNSGAVKLNISGGTEEYRIKTDNTNWVDGDSISTLPIMDNEPVYVLDANDCPSQVDVTITQPDKIAIAVDTIIDAFCGQNNGGISTSISGGTEAYAFNWTYLDSLKPVPVNSNIIGGVYSGQFQLLLSDAHGCTDSLKVSISDTDGPEILAHTIDSISCFGGTDGKITIQQVDGGMPEYAYYLDGIEGDSIFEGLEGKTYHFRLMDKKGCKLDRYYTIPEPEDISILGTVINPVCHDSYDGFIASQINGGNGGYDFDWSNGSTTKDLQNLNSGNYTLTVTDKKACQKSKRFEVIPPPAPTANLDHNVGVLCTGNSLELDGGDYISYQWYKDALLVSENRYLTVDQTGQYTLKISNQFGCIGLDTFDLEVSDTPLDAAIIVKDSAMIDEVVEAIDVTWPVPDSVQWYFDYPVKLVDNNSWMQQFSASTPGVVNVTLRAWFGGCFSDSSKTVTIYYEEGGIIEKSAMNEPLILGYKAYPNPNDGNFFVGIELSRKADIRLQLFNVGSASVVDVKEQYGLDSYDVPFNLSGLRPGVYVIVLIAEREQQKLKIVIE